MTAAARAPESAVVEVARRHLEEEGYRVWVNPDGQDYFDLVARRGDEVGLVEAKVVGARAVITQALRRRAWGSWGAVVVGSRKSAQNLARRTAGTRAEPVGIWCAEGGSIGVVRPSRPWVAEGAEDPYADLRLRFRKILDALESGELPGSVAWDGVVGQVWRASGGRGFREWRLDETRA
jgi:hypothetical protein